jgi:hypothetical protein
MRFRIGVVIASLSVLLATGCESSFSVWGVTRKTGSGRVITETRNVSNFNALLFTGAGDVTIIQGQAESLTVEAEDNVMPLIKTEVRDGTLCIGFERENWQTQIVPTRPIRFNLTVKDLNSIEVPGAVNIQAATLKTERLTVKISGAGNIKIDRLEGSEVTTTFSGAGNLDIAGKVIRQDLTLTGFGNYGASNLESQVAKVNITGAGNATLWVHDTLDMRIAGAGSVNYYGNPKTTKNVAGVGKVTSLGNK